MTAEFQLRLAQAIQDRGLSLAVSVATLSYWTTGRTSPGRANSLEVVRALEEVLGTRPGWLVESLSARPGQHSMAEVLNRYDQLQRAVQEHAVETSENWRTLAVNYHATVAADGTLRCSDTWALAQSISSSARGYAAVLEGRSGTIHPEGIGLVHVRRQIPVADDLSIVEFGLDEPVKRGERVLLGHRITFSGQRPPSDCSGYALKGPIRQLVLQVSFEGQMPDNFTLSSRPPQGDLVVHEKGVRTGRTGVQACLTEPGAGMHDLTWQW